MNPQLRLLIAHDLYDLIKDQLLKTITTTPQTSHEIYDLLKSSTNLQSLQTILNSYRMSGFKEPSSFIGSIASDLVNHGALLRSNKKCAFTKTQKPAFYVL